MYGDLPDMEEITVRAFLAPDGTQCVKFTDGTVAWQFANGVAILGPSTPLDIAGRRAGNTRLFQLHRDVDVTGVSGQGAVSEGGCFPDGVCVMRWLTRTASTAVYSSPDDLIEIHGHGGATRLVWLD